METVSMVLEVMNEADVREEILAPLINSLGYKAGAENKASREVPLVLRYPRSSLGRKKPRTDPYLRGRADYILEVRGHARWVLEAKPSSEEIDEDCIEQAWSYANHPEVRAVYFAVSNGRDFLVYRTSAPPGSEPILQVSCRELTKSYDAIAQLLSADSITRDFHEACDIGTPLGRGLRSLAKVASGKIIYTHSSINWPILSEINIAIVDGTIERSQDGSLISYIVTQAPVNSIQTMIKKMGLEKLPYTSSSTSLSSDPSAPTEFMYSGVAIFKEGEELFDINSGSFVTLPLTIECSIQSRARVVLENGGIVGQIENSAVYTGGIDFVMNFGGDISIRLF
jgi:Type I restriction enzyme R protein N terminus (HSDR_N)